MMIRWELLAAGGAGMVFVMAAGGGVASHAEAAR